MKYTAPQILPTTAFRLKDIANGRAEVFKLDPRIPQREKGHNPREDFGDLAELGENILANGLLQPLVVRKDGLRIFIVDGDRRFTAIESLLAEGRWPVIPGSRTPQPIPCTSEAQNTKPLDRLFATLSLNTGKPLTLLEKGKAYLKALELDPDLNDSDIARRSGETKQAVSNALCLVRQGSPVLIAHIRTGALTATTAIEIIRAHRDSHADQETTAAAAIAAAKSSGSTHATPRHIPKKPAATAPPASRTGDSSVIIPDPDDDEEEENDDDSDAGDVDANDPTSEPVNQSTNPPPHAPADPGAFERLKGAPSTYRDGTSGSGPAPAFASPDQRVKNLEKLMDRLDADVVPTMKWNTAEIILDYLNGNHDIKFVSEFLTK